MNEPTNRPLKICVAQINYDLSNIYRHVERIKAIIAQRREADLLVFPELILHGHPSFQKPEGFLYRRMKVAYREISEDIRAHVRSLGARVIIGELKRRGQEYYNLATYIDGPVAQSYTKTHVHWTEKFTPGKALTTFPSPWGPLGINICFDSAFSEVWRVLALMGAQVMVNISAVPRSFPVAYMWRRLCGAALNNQAYVIYANRPGPFFTGHSAVFDPRGEVLASLGQEDGFLEVEIDLARVAAWRREEAVLPHRRPQLYREIVRVARPELAAPEPAAPPLRVIQSG
ncbi:MAG: carbon-nitrogen hydrolase family protein [Pseudomonadota bacterium]